MNAWLSKNERDTAEKQSQGNKIQIAKEIFLTWDQQGQGSLSEEVIINALVRIGLSTDHHFAKQIMNSIKPYSSKKQKDFSITLQDFITIFKNDEVSNNLMKVINN